MSQDQKLQRKLSLPLITFYGLGTILGAGVYVLIGKVAGVAGVYSPLSFLVAATIAGFSAYTYSHLSRRYPKSAGEVVYVQHGLKSHHLASLVGFLVLATGSISAAAISRGFVGYLQIFWQVDSSIAITLLLVSLGGLAILGIAQSVGVAALVTLLEIGGLMIILFVCREDLGQGLSSGTLLQLPTNSAAFAGVTAGAFLAFYSYIGFEDMVNVAEEVIHVERNLPIAIFIALTVSTLLYFLMAIAATSALPLEQLSASDAPLAEIFVAKTGYSPEVISLISMLAVVNGALVQIIMASRVIYGMAKDSKLPPWLSKVNSHTGTPVRATLLVTAAVLVMALFLKMEALAKLTSGITLTIFGLVNLALVAIEWRTRSGKQRFSKIIVLPAIGACLCLWMLLSSVLKF